MLRLQSSVRMSTAVQRVVGRARSFSGRIDIVSGGMDTH